jgi:hypothetical protein
MPVMKYLFCRQFQVFKKFTEGYNPATWMLEVSSPLAEARLNVDFAKIYATSAYIMVPVAMRHDLSSNGQKTTFVCCY